MKRFFWFGAFGLMAGLPLGALAGDSDRTLTRIAYGSCCHQDKKAPIWEAIVSDNPELFLFMGDNIYGDTRDMGVLRAKYEKLGASPGYRKLLETCPVLAVWDDHDYGENDAGAGYPKKAESQAIFADFYRLTPESPVRQRPGTYDAHTFGPEGQRLQIILLDTRYFRDPLVLLPKKGPHGPYDRIRDTETTILGEAQWSWLEGQLRQPADLRLVVSSIQLLPQEHHWELWENFPHERRRLLRLLRKTGVGGAVILSGDRHSAEIMKLDEKDPLSPGVPVYEVTASSLTNPGGGRADEPNRHRVSPGKFRGVNYGTLAIDWKQRAADFEIRDGKGETVFAESVDFSAW